MPGAGDTAVEKTGAQWCKETPNIQNRQIASAAPRFQVGAHGAKSCDAWRGGGNVRPGTPACAKAQGWESAGHVRGGAEGQREEGSGKKCLGEMGSHPQRDPWALPGLLEQCCRGNSLRRRGQKQEQPGSS